MSDAQHFWRRPIWLLGHLIALVAVLSFVRLGIWQLDRLDEKRDRNRIIAARADGPPVDIDDVDLNAGLYQHVRVRGRYDPAEQVVIRNRAYLGTNGRYVVTPLVLDDGRAVLVNRGWIGLEDAPPPPPAGAVTIEGLLLASQTRGSIGPKDPDEGELDVLNRVDIDRLQAQSDRELFPYFMQLTAPPPRDELPLLVDPPARDEGPHQSYAVQWFLFAGVVLVGYPLLLRRRGRDRGPSGPSGPDGEEWVTEMTDGRAAGDDGLTEHA